MLITPATRPPPDRYTPHISVWIGLYLDLSKRYAPSTFLGTNCTYCITDLPFCRVWSMMANSTEGPTETECRHCDDCVAG